MVLYIEGVIWYLVLLDAMIYNILSWKKTKDTASHWISGYLPLNPFLGAVYLILVLWLGFTLWRLQIITFH